MEEKFENVNNVLREIKDLFKCVMCSDIKSEDSIIFYWSCEHIYCLDCISKGGPCVLCEASDEGKTIGRQVKLSEDEIILALFRSVVNYNNFSLNGFNTEKKQDAANKVQGSKVSEKQSRTMINKNAGESCRKSDDKCDSQTKSKKTINVTKRNHKGETPLHLACRKANISLMQQLVDAGANPNVQDNAGWTPLHDSVAFGRMEVIKFLLENGARVNTPGHENTTALHQSVIQGNVDVAQLLLKYGADKSARNIFGETPMDLIKKYNISYMEDIMINTPAKFKPGSRINKNSPPKIRDDSILFAMDLNENENCLFDAFITQFKLRTADKLLPQTGASHIVVSESKENKITRDIIFGVLAPCEVVSTKWVKDSLEKGTIQPVEKYEMTQDVYVGFAKSRQNKINQLPGLFSGCHFYFGGNFKTYKTKHCTFSKEEIKTLVEKNGGLVLSRNPDPESLALEKTIPYHADINSSIAKTNYYIIYSKESWDPVPKYNMAHMKTLPIEWLLASILKFGLIDPNADQSYSNEI